MSAAEAAEQQRRTRCASDTARAALCLLETNRCAMPPVARLSPMHGLGFTRWRSSPLCRLIMIFPCDCFHHWPEHRKWIGQCCFLGDDKWRQMRAFLMAAVDKWVSPQNLFRFGCGSFHFIQRDRKPFHFPLRPARPHFHRTACDERHKEQSAHIRSHCAAERSLILFI